MDYKLEVDALLSQSKLEIQRATRQAAITRRYSDPKWFQQTQETASELARESQRVQMLVGEVARRIKKLNAQSKGFEGSFVDIAKVILPQEDFERISKAAQRASSHSTATSGTV